MSPRANARSRIPAQQTFIYTYIAKTAFLLNGNRAGSMSNDWAFAFTGPSSPLVADFNHLTTQLIDFWNVKSTNAQYPVGQYLSTSVDRTGNTATVDVYVANPTGADPGLLGQPINSVNYTLTAIAQTGIQFQEPNQIAACLSFRAEYGTDEEYGTKVRPRADDRGRVFLGPFHGGVHGTTGIGNQYYAFNNQFCTDVLDQYTSLYSNTLSNNWQHCVWSRKEKVFKPVAWAFCDNHPDIQSRRGSLTVTIPWVKMPGAP